MMAAQELPQADYPTLGAALAAAFCDVEGVFGSQDFSDKVGYSTDDSGLNRTELGAQTAGPRGALLEAWREGKLGGMDYMVLETLFVSKVNFCGQETIIAMKLFDRVNEKVDKPVPGKFFLEFSIPLWIRGETDRTLEDWAGELDVSLRTMKERSSKASKILNAYRSRAFDSAGKVLRAKGYIE